MPRLYLLVNAALYLVLAVICTFRHVPTSRSVGYVELNASGNSEYLVIYGGLQLGLAAFYFYLAREPNVIPLGITFSLFLYGAIVAYRVPTLLIYRPTSPVTLGTAAVEAALLVWGFVAWKSIRS